MKNKIEFSTKRSSLSNQCEQDIVNNVLIVLYDKHSL